jgi:hypothetical protein
MTHITERAVDGSNSDVNIDLESFSRFIPVYNSQHEIVQSKTGGAVGIRHSSIVSRGAVIKKKLKEEINYKKSPFNNQITLFYEYWGCRYINIMVFTNGKFKIAGAISEHEADAITNIIIDLAKNIKIKIYTI